MGEWMQNDGLRGNKVVVVDECVKHGWMKLCGENLM